jgi:hypothetical protein
VDGGHRFTYIGLQTPEKQLAILHGTDIFPCIFLRGLPRSAAAFLSLQTNQLQMSGMGASALNILKYAMTMAVVLCEKVVDGGKFPPVAELVKLGDPHHLVKSTSKKEKPLISATGLKVMHSFAAKFGMVGLDAGLSAIVLVEKGFSVAARGVCKNWAKSFVDKRGVWGFVDHDLPDINTEKEANAGRPSRETVEEVFFPSLSMLSENQWWQMKCNTPAFAVTLQRNCFTIMFAYAYFVTFDEHLPMKNLGKYWEGVGSPARLAGVQTVMRAGLREVMEQEQAIDVLTGWQYLSLCGELPHLIIEITKFKEGAVVMKAAAIEILDEMLEDLGVQKEQSEALGEEDAGEKSKANEEAGEGGAGGDKRGGEGEDTEPLVTPKKIGDAAQATGSKIKSKKKDANFTPPPPPKSAARRSRAATATIVTPRTTVGPEMRETRRKINHPRRRL